MTNLAQSVTSLTNNHRPALHGELPGPGASPAPARPAQAPDGDLLALTGGVPQDVNVSVIAGLPVFWQKGSSQLYAGITWATNGYALMITFAFVPPPLGVPHSPDAPPPPSVTELIPTTPSLWFSDTFPESMPSNQMCCIPSTLGEYHFDVLILDPATNQQTRHKSVDPKIIVTPIVT